MKFLKNAAFFSLALLLVIVNIGLSFGKDWTERIDLPVYCNPKMDSFQGQIFQKETFLRIAYILSPEDGSVIPEGNFHLSFDPKYFFILGNPVLTDTRTGGTTVIDYIFKNERLIFYVPASSHLQYIECEVASRKLGNRGELTIEDKLKQARTVRWIKPKTDSWSPLSKGQVIAQTTLKAILPHGGYDLNGVKKAVIWANGQKLTGGFQLINALTNRQFPASQPVVFTGELIETGFHIWGGNNYIADFSEFKEEGLFYVRLKVKETQEVVDSFVFPIKNHLYRDLAKKAAGWFYYQRCGTEVPGFHNACHTDDVIIKLDGTRMDVSGGWHDAGDYGKWVGPASVGVLALTTLHEEFGSEFTGENNFPGSLEEAAWGADYLCRGYWDGAFHAGFTSDFEDVCTWLGAPESEPQRVVREEEMLENRYGYSKGPGTSMTGAYLARTGRMLANRDQKLALRCLNVARDIYKIDSRVDLSLPEYKDKLSSYLWLQTGLLHSALELYQATREPDYLKDAEKRAANILDLQDSEGSFFLDQARTSLKYSESRFHLVALYEFLKQNPGSCLNKRIKAAFRSWADLTLQFADVNGFGLIGGLTEDGSPWNLKYQFGNRRISAFAWGLATAASVESEISVRKPPDQRLCLGAGYRCSSPEGTEISKSSGASDPVDHRV
jgi:hypothetical protein